MNGVLHVGGRLSLASTAFEAKHQIISPKKDHMTNLVVDYYHKISGHSGREYIIVCTQANKRTDSGLAVYPFNAVKHVWTCWKALHAEYRRHIQKTSSYALLHLCRHLQPRIDEFWTFEFFARTLSSLSRNNPKWPKCYRFPIEEDKINEWFDYEVPSKGNEVNKVIKIVNVD